MAVAMMGALAGCATDGDDSVATTQVAVTLPAVVSAETTAALAQEYPSNGIVEDVLALDNNFLPQVLTVVAGTEVVFENNGRNVHDVIPEGDLAASEWGVLQAGFEPKDTYSHVFATPGTYTYYCTIHGTPTAAMFGTIIVTAP